MIFVESLIVFVIIAGIWLLVSALMFKKLNKARIKGVILIFLAFVGVGAALLAAGHFLEWHETNEFCTGLGCHAMEPVYESYTEPENNTFMETHYEHNVTCAQCHSGPGLTGLGTSFLPVPKEMWGQFIAGHDPDDLGGHVPSENCLKGCHEHAHVDWQFEAPMPEGQGYSMDDGEVLWNRMLIYHPMTENGTDLSELEKLENCKECHDPRLNGFGFAAGACPVCHDVDREEMELHGEYTCFMAPCHRNEEGEAVQPKIRGHAEIEGHCTSCHDRNHPDDATVPYTVTTEMGTFQVNTTFCTGCHEEAYAELEEAETKHFSSNECQDCHKDHKNRPQCADCHEQGSGIEPQHNVTAPFENCTSCHGEGGHNPLEINFQAPDIAQSSGIISTDFCNSCHQSDVYDTFEDGRLHEKEEFTTDCLACHEVHEEDVDCLSCHTEGGFGGLAEPPGHSVSPPFDSCNECHTEGHFPTELNLTVFRTGHTDPIEDDFCVNCHYDDNPQFHGEQKQELTDSGFSHVALQCSTCHESHDDSDVDCTSCHDDVTAPLPIHDTQEQYGECLECHESGHAPREVKFMAPDIGADFCAEVSCHGDAGSEVTVFQSYGGKHKSRYDCDSCHESHISYDSGFTPDFNCTQCHSDSPPDHTGPQRYEDCLTCHNSAHDPANRAYRPGYNLSQRDYMTRYFVMGGGLTRVNFNWVSRGNHEVYNDCGLCHPSSQKSNYSAAAQAVMNINGTDCSENCHSWIDPLTTGTPFSHLTSSPNPFPKHSQIFNNATTGGCAGFCHQGNPANPNYDGTGHGTVTDCATSNCHANPQGFESTGGISHKKHSEHLDLVDLKCSEACHSLSGQPLEGGCYDCHKSGHDPRILSSSPCYTCHVNNLEP